MARKETEIYDSEKEESILSDAGVSDEVDAALSDDHESTLQTKTFSSAEQTNGSDNTSASIAQKSEPEVGSPESVAAAKAALEALSKTSGEAAKASSDTSGQAPATSTAVDVTSASVAEPSKPATEATAPSTPAPSTTSVSASVKRPKNYVPALDGLRAFAVISVLLYHLHIPFAPGGLMGVTVFFVLSGYLITGLLISEYVRTKKIRLGAFWLRRARRLLPAVILVLLVSSAVFTLVNPLLVAKMRPDMVPSLLFFNNWWQIFKDISYFAQQGAPSPLQHFWSLGIEEQFYLIWPLLVLGALKIGITRRRMRQMILVLAIVSAVWMAYLYDPAGDPSRVYYGLDTRAVSLLLGAFLAFYYPSAAFKAKFHKHYLQSRAARQNAIGWVALAGIVAVVVCTHGYTAFPYYGGIVLVSVLTCLVLIALVNPFTWLARAFSNRVFTWIGLRSYGMYLWHFPIVLLLSHPGNPGMESVGTIIAIIVLTAVVSELSYRFVEDPIRKGALRRAYHAIKDNEVVWPEVIRRPKVACSAAALIALICISAWGIITTPDADTIMAERGQVISSQVLTGTGAEFDAQNPDKADVSGTVGDGSSENENLSEEEAFKKKHSAWQYNDAGDKIYDPVIIGDSVAAGAAENLSEAFPFGLVDAQVSRNIWDSPLPQYLEAGQVGDTIVLSLGTNNAVTDDQVDDALKGIPDTTRVFMLTTRNNREWMTSTNEVIRHAADRHPNLTILDWAERSAGHGEWFYDDGTHLNGEGRAVFTQMLTEAIGYPDAAEIAAAAAAVPDDTAESDGGETDASEDSSASSSDSAETTEADTAA